MKLLTIKQSELDVLKERTIRDQHLTHNEKMQILNTISLIQTQSVDAFKTFQAGYAKGFSTGVGVAAFSLANGTTAEESYNSFLKLLSE